LRRQLALDPLSGAGANAHDDLVRCGRLALDNIVQNAVELAPRACRNWRYNAKNRGGKEQNRENPRSDPHGRLLSSKGLASSAISDSSQPLSCWSSYRYVSKNRAVLLR
jgi:hypothetical protein